MSTQSLKYVIISVHYMEPMPPRLPADSTVYEAHTKCMILNIRKWLHQHTAVLSGIFLKGSLTPLS